jgi:exosortase
MSQHRTPVSVWAVAAVAGSIALLFAPVLARLVQDWYTDDNYSHGFLILPLAALFAYERREQLCSEALRPSTAVGLPVVASGLFLLALGTLASEFFVTRVALIVVLAGAIAFLLGWGHLRILGLPLAFLLLMIPIPAIIFNQIAFPLQLLASRLGESLMWAGGVPVLREGNVIVLANTTLEVAEACSGIRSLVSLFTLGIVFGYFLDSRPIARVAIAAATIPIAILTNAIRVAGTGIAAHYWSPSAAEGFFHTFSGWLVFGTAVVLLLVVARLLRIGRRSAAPVVAPQFS